MRYYLGSMWHPLSGIEQPPSSQYSESAMSHENNEAEPVPLLECQPLDDQHRASLKFLASLHQAIVNESSLSEQRLRLHEFLSHLRVHCSKEEHLMLNDEYPGRQAHAMAHLALIQQLKWFDEILVRSGPSAALEALREITNDFFSHVNWEDRRMVQWHQTHSSPSNQTSS
jgi:hemerythrin-like metal-binding protein